MRSTQKAFLLRLPLRRFALLTRRIGMHPLDFFPTVLYLSSLLKTDESTQPEIGHGDLLRCLTVRAFGKR